MSDEELDTEILFIEANFNSNLEKGTIEMNNEYFNLLQEKMARLIDENQKLKKQLETVRKKYEFESKNRDKIWKILMKKETQQKEFIEYLEKNINHYKEIIKLDRENNTESDCRRFEARWTTYEEILLKYKEIIKENFYKSRKTIKERIRK